MREKFMNKQTFFCIVGFKKSLVGIFTFCAFVFCLSLNAYAQKTESNDSPVIVQPGSPGQATKILPPATTAKLPPVSKMDVKFMQGMIHHHAQAVEMVALIESRTENKEVRLLGSRISHSQAEEIEFMKRWLEIRGEKTSMAMPEMDKMDMTDMDMSSHNHKQMLMPGMLTAKQMKALADAKGAEFDKLFLTGMIQHHTGALVMVDELFKTAGAGQEAQLFNFATDVDSGQRAEIRIMQNILGK